MCLYANRSCVFHLQTTSFNEAEDRDPTTQKWNMTQVLSEQVNTASNAGFLNLKICWDIKNIGSNMVLIFHQLISTAMKCELEKLVQAPFKVVESLVISKPRTLTTENWRSPTNIRYRQEFQQSCVIHSSITYRLFICPEFFMSQPCKSVEKQRFDLLALGVLSKTWFFHFCDEELEAETLVMHIPTRLILLYIDKTWWYDLAWFSRSTTRIHTVCVVPSVPRIPWSLSKRHWNRRFVYFLGNKSLDWPISIKFVRVNLRTTLVHHASSMNMYIYIAYIYSTLQYYTA